MNKSHISQGTINRIAIVYPGDRIKRGEATNENNRFSDLSRLFLATGTHVEPAVYHDDFHDEVRDQLMKVDGVLVWFNPNEGGRDRAVLDSMLREVAAAGVFVSTHPDVILKLGTKEVLYTTRSLGWGCDTHLYESMLQMRQELPGRLAAGKARVLKQYRGSSGDGIWKIEPATGVTRSETPNALASKPCDVVVRVRHAKRGGTEEEMTLEDFFKLCDRYFMSHGKLIDQEYQERLPEGMVRCYLVQDKVAGFGHQAINALCPPPPGVPSSEAPQPSARLYHPPTKREFQMLKTKVEQEWVPAAQEMLGIETRNLPVLWDCDFLLGPRLATGEDTYVLCEINVSSVAPYPESAMPYIVETTLRMIGVARQRRSLA